MPNINAGTLNLPSRPPSLLPQEGQVAGFPSNSALHFGHFISPHHGFGLLRAASYAI